MGNGKKIFFEGIFYYRVCMNNIFIENSVLFFIMKIIILYSI